MSAEQEPASILVRRWDPLEKTPQNAFFQRLGFIHGVDARLESSATLGIWALANARHFDFAVVVTRCGVRQGCPCARRRPHYLLMASGPSGGNRCDVRADPGIVAQSFW